MFELMMVLALSGLNGAQSQTAGFQPCIWPKCSKPVLTAEIQPCIWPKCSKTEILPALDVTRWHANAAGDDIEICLWPNKCA